MGFHQVGAGLIQQAFIKDLFCAKLCADSGGATEGDISGQKCAGGSPRRGGEEEPTH